MTFIDMLRLHGPMLFGTLFFLLCYLVACQFVLKKISANLEEPANAVKMVRYARALVPLVVLGAVGYILLHSASVNMAPQSVIDRSAMEQQADKIEQEAIHKQFPQQQ